MSFHRYSADISFAVPILCIQTEWPWRSSGEIKRSSLLNFFFSLSRVIQPPWDTKCFIKLYFHKHALNLQTCVLWKQHCWGTLKQNIESLPTVNSNSNCVYIWANQFCPLGSNKNFKKRVLPKHRHWIRTYQRNVTTPNMES